MKNFLLVAVAFSIIAELLVYLIFNRVFPEFDSPLNYWIAPFLLLVFGLAHWQLISSLRKNAKRFVTLFMGVTGGKMLLSLFIMLILAVLMKEAVKPLAVTFIAIYLPFMVIEVIFILKELREVQKAS
ncbi:MAG: hypothetical protein ACK40M_06465 [Flavobacteriales bacterium]